MIILTTSMMIIIWFYNIYGDDYSDIPTNKGDSDTTWYNWSMMGLLIQVWWWDLYRGFHRGFAMKLWGYIYIYIHDLHADNDNDWRLMDDYTGSIVTEWGVLSDTTDKSWLMEESLRDYSPIFVGGLLHELGMLFHLGRISDHLDWELGGKAGVVVVCLLCVYIYNTYIT